jgi:diketogulonate reductase-like aldo/keto reductase
MRTVSTRTGAVLPVLGLGTWMMGQRAAHRAAEADALRLGLDLGMTLIDTAEMYADGGAEEVVADAIEGRRAEVFLVSKVLPANASRRGTVAACERSLGRLRTDRLDLYLLHWTGSHPLEDTLAAFVELREAGKILHYGVSNFDIEDMRACESLPGGNAVASNQVLYNPQRRGIERNLLPWCVERGVPVMAYSPLDQGRLDVRPGLRRVAERHGATPEQIAVAWSFRDPGLVSIPKAGNPEHVRQNASAAALELTAEDLAEIDADYPVPDHDVPLETA